MGIGSGASIHGAGFYGASVSTIESTGTGEKLTFYTPLKVTTGSGLDNVETGGLTFSLDNKSSKLIQPGMALVGDGISPGTVIGKIAYGLDGNVAAFTLVDGAGNLQPVPKHFSILTFQGLDFSRFVVPQLNPISDTLVTNAPIAGFQPGQEVVSPGLLSPGTVIKSVTRTLDALVNLATAAGLVLEIRVATAA